ncbi:hypothetical protein SAMN05216188_101968 [Lentzea xinjiangensis]|uniref:Uncharacterized protein n=1 Tax=Lentzea xinjiangensis TaxID=402600 RepID=A0A1H9BXJ5_9PSEU|nr:hypothetical protein SAMN05216188_101968 [Lentzea xinjiangensis]
MSAALRGTGGTTTAANVAGQAGGSPALPGLSCGNVLT